MLRLLITDNLGKEEQELAMSSPPHGRSDSPSTPPDSTTTLGAQLADAHRGDCFGDSHLYHGVPGKKARDDCTHLPSSRDLPAPSPLQQLPKMHREFRDSPLTGFTPTSPKSRSSGNLYSLRASDFRNQEYSIVVD